MRPMNGPTAGTTEFEINPYLTLRLEGDETVIYVAGKELLTCKYLLFEIPETDIEDYSDIESIDATINRYGKEHELRHELLDPETEFWGHCSNLQAWAENSYDTRLLDKRLAFPLLWALTDEGDPQAKKAFKEEIARRLENGSPTVKTYLLREGYLKYLTEEELDTITTAWAKYQGERIPVIKNSLFLNERGIEDLSEVEGLFELDSLERLELRENDLKELPADLDNLSSLKELDLRANQLTTIPKSIGNLTSLETLYLNGNVDEIPESIGNLTSLENLYLSNNRLRNIPPQIINLSSLRKLKLGSNQLTSLPDVITNLDSLRILDLKHNNISILPDTIGKFTQLWELDLWNNQLTTLPDTIGNLTQLRELGLAKNQLTSLPESIGNLTLLKKLWFEQNNIASLPKSFANLKSLELLDAEDNQFPQRPKEIKALTRQGKLSIYELYDDWRPKPLRFR